MEGLLEIGYRGYMLRNKKGMKRISEKKGISDRQKVKPSRKSQDLLGLRNDSTSSRGGQNMTKVKTIFPAHSEVGVHKGLRWHYFKGSCA
ncbi:hypothetical protein NPIL_399621 [Nephila pilipes]|uniref:Uncharacterized protein n=1 Tax=Nephila pilipes TaxID=299642 RepID=A0A8X6QTW7_NEPPI|nr:hypothetical protein NPIL_399621 [Nephila pilipes]